jgi:hypothetical protein
MEIPGPEQLPANELTSFTDVLAAAQRLVAESSDALLLEGEEDRVVGRRRELINGAGSSSVSVALYLEEARPMMRQLLESETDIEGSAEPVGHIEFSSALADASFSGMVYLFEDETMQGVYDCSVSDPEEILGHDSEACYDFAAMLGAADIWARHMFDGEPVSHHRRRVNEPQARELSRFLQSMRRSDNTG